MKKKVLLISTFIPFSIFAQNIDFDLKGKLDSAHAEDKIFLQYRKDTELITDSIDIVDGRFSLSGVVSEPTRATIFVGESLVQASRLPRKTLYLEETSIELTSKSSLAQADIIGGRLNTDLNLLNGHLEPITAKSRALNEKYRNASEDEQKDEVFLQQIRQESEAINEERKEVIQAFIKQHPNSLVSLDNINTVAGYAPDIQDIEPLFLSLSESVRNSNAGKRYAESIEKIRLTSIGKPAPVFQQEDINGKLVSLTDFKGQYLFVDFWASWCGPCRQENPHVVKAYHALKDKNFTILGVSLDRPGQKDAWLKAIEDDNLEWTQVSDLKFWDNAVARQYNIQSIPQNFLIDPNGVIIAKNLRGEDLIEKIELYLR